MVIKALTWIEINRYGKKCSIFLSLYLSFFHFLSLQLFKMSGSHANKIKVSYAAGLRDWLAKCGFVTTNWSSVRWNGCFWWNLTIKESKLLYSCIVIQPRFSPKKSQMVGRPIIAKLWWILQVLLCIKRWYSYIRV